LHLPDAVYDLGREVPDPAGLPLDRLQSPYLRARQKTYTDV